MIPGPQAIPPNMFKENYMIKLTVAEMLSMQIDACGKSQVQIAREAGYKRANIITMLKQGHTKIPIQRVPALARAIGLEPSCLLRKVLAEYHPEILATIEETLRIELGRPPVAAVRSAS